ncbi:type 1 fimbria chaperone FimC [Escherichia coli]|nr:type 1 fimbria chaperone FimC [Escherichia coli]EHM0112482.1 type 1 fimbria chaperone FimC [Escherichia coli]
MMTKIKLLMLIIFYLIISASAHAVGGIALGATRIIYPADAKQTAVWIRNSHTNERFLVNSWIENSSGVKEKSFIITPPLFVSEPKSENTLRIIYTGPPLAADRESLFWMNVKTIPSVDKNALNGRNVLQLAILSRMKLFLRPIQLQELPAEAPDTLKFSRSGNYINVHNPSPFYVTLVNLQVGSQKLGNAMAAPRVSSQIPLPSGVQGKLKFQTVNDYGSVTPVREVNLN